MPEVALEKKDGALEAERSARSTAEKHVLEAHASNAADTRARLAAERKARSHRRSH